MACQWQPASCFLCASARAADLLRSPPVIPPSQGCAPQQLCHLPQGAGSLRSQCAGRRRGARHSPLRYRPAAGRRPGCPGTLMPSGGGTACGMLSTLAARHLRAGLSAHQGRSHHREPYGRPSGALPRGRHQAGVRHRLPPYPRGPDVLSRPLSVSREGGAGRLCSRCTARCVA